MKTLLMLFCLLAAAAGGAGADITNWIAVSDRRDNALIAATITGSPLRNQIAIITALGARKDFYVSEIIDCLAFTRSPRDVPHMDYLLRLLLSSVFLSGDGAAGDGGVAAECRARLLANQASFDKLVMGLASFPDLQLRAEIVRLIPCSGSPQHRGALLAESDMLLEMLADGKLTAAQEDYVLTWLLAVERIGDPVFLEPCLRIYERSSQPAVNRLARRVIQGLRKIEEPGAG
jgi:hypothetical protein